VDVGVIEYLLRNVVFLVGNIVIKLLLLLVHLDTMADVEDNLLFVLHPKHLKTRQHTG